MTMIAQSRDSMWQTINCAPRDGQLILVGYFGGAYAVPVRWDADGGLWRLHEDLQTENFRACEVNNPDIWTYPTSLPVKGAFQPVLDAVKRALTPAPRRKLRPGLSHALQNTEAVQ